MGSVCSSYRMLEWNGDWWRTVDAVMMTSNNNIERVKRSLWAQLRAAWTTCHWWQSTVRCTGPLRVRCIMGICAVADTAHVAILHLLWKKSSIFLQVTQTSGCFLAGRLQNDLSQTSLSLFDSWVELKGENIYLISQWTYRRAPH